jgi:hypothetical protein
MQLPESFYIALCGTILLLGVIYWFWTQTQYIQRKVNLLENVVYEMKTLLSNLPGQTAQVPEPVLEQDKIESVVSEFEPLQQKPYAPPPESVAGDLEEERANSENEFTTFVGASDLEIPQKKDSVPDDLMPGGLASPEAQTGEQADSIDKSLDSPLQTMTTKELRRMAEAQGIPGASELKKKELVKILREKVGTILKNSEQPTIMSFEEIGAPLTE